MSTDKIIQHLINDDVASAKTETENLLYSKIKDVLNDSTADLISSVYENSVGLAGLLEKKKKKEDEELDPVGKEDDDIDNDGEVDNQDEYLNKRRDAVGKAIGKRKNNDEDEDE